MNVIADWISAFDSFLWGAPLPILLFGCHIFLTFFLKFALAQRYVFLGIRLSVRNDARAEGGIGSMTQSKARPA